MAVNDIGVEGVKSVSEILKTNTALTSLDLGCNEERTRKRRERNDERLTGFYFGVEGAKSVSKMLMTNTALTSLNLECD